MSNHPYDPADKEFSLTGMLSNDLILISEENLMHALCDSIPVKELLDFIAYLAWNHEDTRFLEDLMKTLDADIADVCVNENVPVIAKYLRSELNNEDREVLKSLL